MASSRDRIIEQIITPSAARFNMYLWLNKIFINLNLYKLKTILRIIISSNEIAFWMTSLRLPLSRQVYNAARSRSFFSPWTWEESRCPSLLQEIQCFRIECKRRKIHLIHLYIVILHWYKIKYLCNCRTSWFISCSILNAC